jgi:spore coat polysaccharide biosynthesis protein SpsF
MDETLSAMRIAVVVQARMGSSRFPRKVLEPILGKPLLLYLVESLRHCRTVDAVVVATSTDAADDALAEFCATQGLQCIRGPLCNVAERFLRCMDAFPCEAVVRVNGDSPLLDHRLVDQGVSLFRQGGYDVVTNVCPRSFPKGQSVEVLSVATYRSVFPLMRDPADLEHVTRYFYGNRGCCRLYNFSFEPPCSDLQMSVDTPQDLARVAALLGRMSRPHWQYRVEEMVALERNPGDVRV